MKYLPYILTFILGCIFMYFIMDYFSPCKDIVVPISKVEAKLKANIDTQEKEVKVLKEGKEKRSYKTTFDSSSTIDTVKIELAKCDTIVKIDSVIMAKQDTIIIDQKELIETYEGETKSLLKEVKKEKRKTLFTKIVAGVAIIVTILLVK